MAFLAVFGEKDSPGTKEKQPFQEQAKNRPSIFQEESSETFLLLDKPCAASEGRMLCPVQKSFLVFVHQPVEKYRASRMYRIAKNHRQLSVKVWNSRASFRSMGAPISFAAYQPGRCQMVQAAGPFSRRAEDGLPPSIQFAGSTRLPCLSRGTVLAAVDSGGCEVQVVRKVARCASSRPPPVPRRVAVARADRRGFRLLRRGLGV